MRCLKLHFDVFKISLVHIVTAWQPKCQKLPKYQVLFLLLYVPFFRSSHTTTFGRACPYHGFQEKSPCIIWDPDAAPVCKPQERCLCSQARGVASSSKPRSLGVKVSADGIAPVYGACSYPPQGEADLSGSCKPALLIWSPPPMPQPQNHHIAHPAGSFPGATTRWEGQRCSASLPVGW